MNFKLIPLSSNHHQSLRKVPLRWLLIVPFMLQISAAVGLTGWLSIRNGQKAVNEVASQLRSQISARADQYLDHYLAEPHLINQINAKAIEIGQLNLNDTIALERWFAQQVQIFEQTSYIYMGGADGKAVVAYIGDEEAELAEAETLKTGQGFVTSGSTTKFPTRSYYTLDRQGNRVRWVDADDTFDPRDRPWYKAAKQAQRAVWSDIYLFSSDNFPGITASAPIYDNKGKFKGVVGTDLVLSDISDFLQKLKFSPTGKIFIMERSGDLIASSTDEKPFIQTKVGEDATRIKAIDSQDPLIQATAKHLIDQFGDLKKIRKTQQIDFVSDQQQEFLQVLPYKDEWGLDWLVVIVVPESDFMAQINANTKTTILLCLLALAIASLLGVYTSRWITQPILQLSQVSQDIASGQLDQKVGVSQVKELGVLAQSFNKMASQLRASFTALEETNEQLEQRVEERTSELKISKEEAEAAKAKADIANNAKSDFLANMSHELRTPLNGILGYAQILQRSKSLTPKDHKGADIIHQCGSHLLTLINDILDLSKIEARKLELNAASLHLESFLQGVMEICQIKAEQKGIDFIYQADSGLPRGVYADEKRLRQVLINLLGNAIKFTDKGSVTFKVERMSSESTKTQKIRFQIIDTGIGMATEAVETIFLPFEQVGDAKKQSEGTGLGLAISQQIVALMDSRLEVQSQLGQGSTFWFDVELAEADDWIGGIKTRELRVIKGFQGTKRKILLVDDRWENRSVIMTLLEPIGFEMIEANNGNEGLEQAIAFQPDIIITDLVMPGMDGFEMIRQLRATTLLNQVPIITSSTSIFASEQNLGLAAGANDFLSKPIQADALLELLQKHLNLDWIYELSDASDQPNEDSVNLQPVESKPQDVLKIPPSANLMILYDLAMQGLLKELEDECDRQEKANATYAPFIQSLRQLAQSFQITKIQTVLEQYLESQD
jgi:signal transduction histidine kinase/FixJ family two-component response regulator